MEFLVSSELLIVAENASTSSMRANCSRSEKDKAEFKSHECTSTSYRGPSRCLRGSVRRRSQCAVTLSYSSNRVQETWLGLEPPQVRLSHGLRFDVIRPTESIRRVQATHLEGRMPAQQTTDHCKETESGVLGDDRRTHGSLHSRLVDGSRLTLHRVADGLSVYPVKGLVGK